MCSVRERFDSGVVGFSYNDGTKEGLLRPIIEIMSARGR